MAEGPKNTGFHPGFVWGCLAPVLAVVLIVGGWFAYNTYYYTSGYKEAPGLPAVMAAVNAHPVATRVLGDDIHILQMEFNMPSNAKQNGHRITYIVRVRGTKAEGRIQSSVLIEPTGTKITSLTLLGTDRNYSLMRDGQVVR